MTCFLRLALTVPFLLPAAASDGDAPPKASASSQQQQQRLGTSGQRNENVVIYFIDTNAIKEANIRLGTNPTAIHEPLAESQYFAAEHGRPPSETLMLRPVPSPASWHGEGFWWLQNSIFNARTFFQVGGVKPSRRNFDGGRLTGLVPKLGALTLTFSHRAIRGMVNGNVLVPLASERTPLVADPQKRALIQRFLDAYPKDLPNRLDFDQRALNTNSPQHIDEVSGSARLDRSAGAKGKVFLSYSMDRQRILAFQLVAGQNPNTEIHNHRAKATWQYSLSSATVLHLGAGFSRNRSALVSEPNAVGPRVRFGYSIEELGPESMFPINRATNSFRYGASLQHHAAGGRHQISAGIDYVRLQLNGIETNNSRGQFQFGSNFGRNSIDNLRWGTPNMYEVAVGGLDRGYRNRTITAYVADKWKAAARLQVYFGLSYMADTRPVEVNGRERIPYSTDWNNFAPRLALTWQAGRGWIARAMYTTAFSQILPVTYQQARLDPPGVHYLMIPDPDLLHPLQGIDLSNGKVRYSPTWLSGNLVSPYSHLYSGGVEHKLMAGSVLRLSYIGSRSIKLLNNYTLNRAEPVAGIPLTTATVDLRRPDPRYNDVKLVNNGGVAYFDAGQAAWDLPRFRGIATSLSYTFSKAIDEGPDFTATAANKDIQNFRNQWQYDSFGDRKGLSNFDSTHALQFNYTYDVPAPRAGASWLHAIASNWQISGANMWKRGTPLTLYIGSDAPGYGNVDGGGGDRPNILDPSILGKTIGNPDTSTQILSRSRFAFLVPGQHAGSLGRGTFRKSAIWNWNAALARQLRFHNEWLAQFRAEAYNLSNTPQFDEPQRNLSSPAFGKITNTLNDGRVFQFTLRFVF